MPLKISGVSEQKLGSSLQKGPFRVPFRRVPCYLCDLQGNPNLENYPYKNPDRNPYTKKNPYRSLLGDP